MIISHTYLVLSGCKKQIILIVGGILLLVFSTIGLDFLSALFHGSAFYILESLLFSSSFWILFLPLLFIQTICLKKNSSLTLHLLLINLVTLLHLLLYPALIWALSKLFYTHTFSYWKSFNFGLNTYLITTLIIYSFAFITSNILKKKIHFVEEKELIKTNNFILTIVVTDQHNKKLVLATDDISYFSANSPYIIIHHQSKKYLHTETLKSLEKQLNYHQFIRIHKSYIVNLQKVASYQSRQNGDYDLTLTNGSVLRLSRNYAQDFKSKFYRLHHLSTK